jgi:hypothetical protein
MVSSLYPSAYLMFKLKVKIIKFLTAHLAALEVFIKEEDLLIDKMQ